MSCKRSSDDRDPDYDDLNTANDQKRLKVIEKDNKDATLRKIEQIIRSQFGIEMSLKEKEIDTIDERLYQAMKMLDQLRACVVSAFYSFEKLSSENTVAGTSSRQPPIHPAVKRFLGKAPKTENLPGSSKATFGVAECTSKLTSERIHTVEPVSNKQAAAACASTSTTKVLTSCVADVAPDAVKTEAEEEVAEEGSRAARFKVRKRVVIGNVSKYIPVDKREERDQSTHKWMVYVRGPKEQPDIGGFVKKVWFFLHPSYRPNDLVEVTQPPFHLTRRGWGEFPVRVQLHFRDARNKRVDIIHTLRLDKTYTGLQTLGAETLVDVLVYRENGLLLRPALAQHATAANTTGHQSLSPFRCPLGVGGITIPAMVAAGDAASDDKLRTIPKIKRESLVDFDAVDEASNYVIFGSTPNSSSSPLKTESIWTDVTTNSDGSVDRRVASFLNDHGSYTSSFGGAAATLGTVIKNEPMEHLEPEETLPDDWFGSGSEEPLSGCVVVSEPESEQMDDVLEEPVLDDIEVSPVPAVPPLPPVSPLNRMSCLQSTTPAAVSIQQSPSNGATTAAFIQCADKSGQMFLVPLATFLKLSKHQPNNSHLSSLLLLPPASSTSTTTGSSSTTSLLRHPSPTSCRLPVVATLNGPSNSLAPPPIFIPTATSGVRGSLLASTTPRYPVINCVLRPPAANVRPTAVAAATTASVVGSRPEACRSLLGGQMRGGLAATKHTSIGTSAAICAAALARQLDGGCGGNIRRVVEDRKRVETTRTVDVDRLSSMDDIASQVVKCFPLVQPNPDRCAHPYCAPSLAIFLSWPVGKRRAAEWQRAKSVCRKIAELIAKSNEWKAEAVWTTKRMLTWCRHRGYSPLHPAELSDTNEPPEVDDESERVRYTPSLSDAVDLVHDLEKELHSVAPSAPEEELVDVEDDQEVDKPVSKASPEKPILGLLTGMPSTPCGDWVRQTAEQIGINLKMEEVCERTVAPLAEEVMVSAMTQFVDDIMRNALANAFDTNKDTRKQPGCIDIGNVVNSIRGLPHCDFLTNHGLGNKIHHSQLIKKSDFKL